MSRRTKRSSIAPFIAGAAVLLGATASTARDGHADQIFPHERVGRMSSWKTWIEAAQDDRTCDFSYQDVGTNAPKFSDFPAEPDGHLSPHPPLITRNMRSLRTIIRRGASQGVNFAGHYTFAPFGIGTGRCWFVIDQQTGVVSNDKHGACDGPGNTLMGNGDQDPQFRLNSRLLVLSGLIDKDRVGVAYYEWTGARLKMLRFYRWDDLERCREAKPKGAAGR
jgi:hypothetical protein